MRGIGSIVTEHIEVEIADGSTVATTVRLLTPGDPWDVFEDDRKLGTVKKYPARRPPVAWEARTAAGDRIVGTRSRRHAVRAVVAQSRGLPAGES